MKLPSLSLAATALAPLLLLDTFTPSSFAAAADVGFSSTSQNGRFPFLTKMRDGAIELIFGAHPSKSTSTADIDDQRRIRYQYANEVVLRFNVSTTDEEAALAEAATRMFLDIWALTTDFVDIRLHSNQIAPLLSLLPRSMRYTHSTLIPDLAAAVYESRPSDGRSKLVEPDLDRYSASLMTSDIQSPGGDNLFFRDYQPLPVIVRWMRLLEAMFPTYVEYFSIGESFEGRDIPALRVGVPTEATPETPRKTIVVTGGLHAREWISTATVNYLAWSMITSFGKEPMITKLLDEFNVVFIPAMNPDGLEYTWHVDRLWRKSRQQTNLRFCRGLDLDHAFGYRWDGSAQTDACSETYGGEEPFEAVEAERLASWAKNETLHNVRFVGLLDLHSYSQQVLFPFSFSCAVDPPNMENLEELAAGIAKAIRLTNGELYSVSSACEGAVVAERGQRQASFGPRVESGGGSAIDWFFHEMRAHYSYQIKLRDTGSYGFLLPREYIVPTGEEVFNAMKYFGDYLLGNNGIERAADDGSKSTTNENEHRNQDPEESESSTDDDGNRNSELRKRKFRA